MSTWLYLECRHHDPRLVSEGESGQHLSDLPQIRADLLDGPQLVAALEAGDLDNESHYRRNTARFLKQHPKCALGIRDEYGVAHPSLVPIEELA